MAEVLLLNASYTPLNIISVKRAVALMEKGKAVAISGVAATLRSAKDTFTVPSVLKMNYYVRVPDKKAVWSKWGVLRRDNYTCVYCGHHSGNRKEFTIDHIIPKAHGGRNSWTNTACSCFPCNQRKDNRTPTQAGMKLLFEPKIPRVNYLVLSGHVPIDWKLYIKT
jgi:hypothetical protein